MLDGWVGGSHNRNLASLLQAGVIQGLVKGVESKGMLSEFIAHLVESVGRGYGPKGWGTQECRF